MASPVTLLRLMQLTDSMFPMGAFVHSNGLETYTDAKAVRSMADLKALIGVRLEAAGESDLVFVKEALLAAQQADLPELLELDEMLSAFRTAHEARLASVKVGRQLLRMAASLFDDPLLAAYQKEVQAGNSDANLAIVYGIVYAAGGFDPQTALLAYTYQVIVGQTSAAAKLMSVGQTQLQGLIQEMQPAAALAVEKAMYMTIEDCGSFTPGLDIRTMQHQYLFRRLFHS
jgi:urease accessory protein